MLPGFDEQVSDMDSRLLDTQVGFGSSALIEMKAQEVRPVSAIVDIESKNAGLHGGSVRGVIGSAEISSAEAAGVDKGDVFVWGGVRYSIINHPILLNKNWVQLELGVIDEQSVPDIRY